MRKKNTCVFSVTALVGIIGIVWCFLGSSDGVYSSIDRGSVDVRGRGLSSQPIADPLTLETIRGAIQSFADNTGAARGAVSDNSTGERVSRGVVYLKSDKDGKAALNGSGEFCLTGNLEAGVIVIDAPGYKVREIVMELDDAKCAWLDVGLEPAGYATVCVTDGFGKVVVGAKVYADSSSLLPVWGQWGNGNQERVFFETNENGIALIPLTTSHVLYAIGPSGAIGSAQCGPGIESTISLPADGARLFVKTPDGEAFPGELLLRIHCSGEDSTSNKATYIKWGPTSEFILGEGNWSLAIESKVFGLERVGVDGSPVMTSPFPNQTAFCVNEATKQVTLTIGGGFRIKLLVKDTNEPFVGEFVWSQRYPRPSGEFREGAASSVVADAQGTALVPALAMNNVEVSIVVPGYTPIVVRPEALAADWGPIPILYLSTSPPTGLFLRFQNGDPIQTWVRLVAVGLDSRIRVFQGIVRSDGNVSGLSVPAGCDLSVYGLNGVMLGLIPDEELIRGINNSVMLNIEFGTAEISGIQNAIDLPVIVGKSGIVHQWFPEESGKFVTQALIPGRYFIGPLALANRLRKNTSLWSVSSNNLIGIQIHSGVSTEIKWDSRAAGEGSVSGEIEICGNRDQLLSIIPLYPEDSFLALPMGPLTERIPVDSNLMYEFSSEPTPPERLLLCSEDMYSRPIPLGLFDVGQRIVARTCGVELSWVGGGTSQVVEVVISISTEPIDHLIRLKEYEYPFMWNTGQPLYLSGLPEGETLVSVHFGESNIERNVTLSCNQTEYLVYGN